MTTASAEYYARRARLMLAAVQALNAASQGAIVIVRRHDALRPGSPVAWLSGGAVLVALALSLIVVAAVSAWQLGASSDPRRWRGAGLSCLLSSAALWELANVTSGNILVEHVCAGASLLGWLLGAAYAGAIGRPDRSDTLGLRGGAAAFGVGYLISVVSKFRYSGLAWTSPATIWSSVYSHRSVDGQSPARVLADWLLSSPLAARGVAAGTLALEVATVLLLGPARLRIVGAAAVISIHLGFLSFRGSTGVFPPLVALLFMIQAWSSRGLDEDAAPADATKAARALTRFVAVALLGIGCAWLLGIALSRSRGVGPLRSDAPSSDSSKARYVARQDVERANW